MRESARVPAGERESERETGKERERERERDSGRKINGHETNLGI